jgi:uncharacterized protein (TIGR03437 family)
MWVAHQVGGTMLAVLFRALGAALVLAGSGFAATFGTVVPVRGAVSDIALDESRGRLYAANFGAYRVEVIDTAAKALLAPLAVPAPPSAVAVSPDSRFLVIGEYQKPVSDVLGGFMRDTGGLTILDLSSNSRTHLDLTAPVVAVAFGADGQALVVTRTPVAPLAPANVFLLDPASATITVIGTVAVESQNLSVPLNTFPAQTIQAAAGVSGDRRTIVVLTNPDFTVIRYDVPSRSIVFAGQGAAVPPLGPRTVSVDQNASNLLMGWALFRSLSVQRYQVWAQFPQPDGVFNIGTHAWDLRRNLIYAQIPAPGDGAVLHIVDTDNLTVRERIQLPENLAGKSVLSSDMNTMYSASVSGVAILPVGQLGVLPQVSAAQEDLLFQGDACNAGAITRTLDLASLGSSPADFKLSLPDGTTGIRLLTTSGTTPAQVQIQVDPSAFQSQQGTSQVSLTITSSTSVNLPPVVRLLINTKDFNQRGRIVNIPGKLVDIMADPARSRLYVLRQDRNVVLVYDLATLSPVVSLRTGNTPVGMSMTTDSQFLIVGNDNSQIANVFDLNNLVASDPILFPGDYPRTIGVSAADMFATVRLGAKQGATHLDQIDFANRVAYTPVTLNGSPDPAIYSNNLSSPDGALAESADHDFLLLALPDGNVVEYDASAQAWVASRKEASSLAGAYGVLTDNLFLADSSLLDAALAPIGQLPASEGTSSGMGRMAGAGLRTTASSASGAGLIERIDPANLQSYNATAMAEAPLTQASLLTPAVGQIGETILPFTRTLAVAPDQSKIFALTISGLTVLDPNFDAPTPAPFISNIVNAADFTAGVAPGGAIQINGGGFAQSPVSAGAPPLPTELGNVCATVNDIALPLFSVSPAQLTAQLPFSAAGSASLVVRAPGGISSPFPFTIQSFAPAVFFNGTAGDQTGLAMIVRDDNNQLVDFTNPLHPRRPITIYLTGLGATSPLPALGAAAPADPPATVNTRPSVNLGAASLAVSFAGLVAGQVGVYRIDATVPNVVPVGVSVPLTIRQGGFSTTVRVRVVSP